MNEFGGNVLLIGYGNPGRLDDGLGQAFAERANVLGIPRLTIETCYQLAVEHAEMASRFDVVIFADASINGAEPYEISPITPQTTIAFSTHHVSPQSIVGLAQQFFDSAVEGYTLAIRGYEFDDFGEQLSTRAIENLTAALEHLESLLGEAIQTN